MEAIKSSGELKKSMPDEWYVYDGKEIKGPYNFQETFALSSETSEGSQRLVSRKGFSQWYSLGDLSQIFRYVNSEGKTESVGKSKSPSSLGQFAQDQSDDSTDATLMKPLLRDLNGKKAPPLTNEISLKKRPKVERGWVSKEKGSLKSSQPKKENAQTFNTNHPLIAFRAAPADQDFACEQMANPSQILKSLKSPNHAHPKTFKKTGKALFRDYIFAQGHLRLGVMRQPWITGLIGIPITLGVKWYFWFRDFAHEIRNHSPQYMYDLPPHWLAVIPGIHIYMVYRLAREVERMERENHYSHTNPRKAAILALFPPFALIYLQIAANQHWLLHVRHLRSVVKGEGKSNYPQWSPAS